ncbi:extracellular solute-binding protein [Auraticoccus sp. F435]|uniref:Extracellular solute-binding protein n=1 Tax=Auraticoccus cholistanensis TaxID=2656650 RepID=A0A6A9UZZ7_9ACTN|nr:extracellular solute-binding protein [Auraticoccus cholistanensis]MVA74709.1 extracellular solute-binding protein [Auraticoccus cholistanensis]
MTSTTRRPARLALAAGAVLSLLAVTAGCSTAGSGAAGVNGGELQNADADKEIQEGDRVVTYLSQSPDADREAIRLFEEANPGYKVTMYTAPGTSYQQVVTTQLAGGTAPDVLRTFPGNGSNLAVVQASEKGFLADLSDLSFTSRLSESLRSVMVDGEGRVVGVPMNSSGIGGMYNATALEEAGLSIPTTWSEVLQFCADASDAGKVAYGLGLKDAWTGQMVPYALAATLVQDDPELDAKMAAGETSFADSEWRDVFAKYLEMGEAGCFNDNPNGTAFSTVQDELRAGDTLATVGLSLTIGATLTGAPTGTEIEFAPLPATDDPAETRLSTGVGVTLSMNAKAADPEAAKKFLEFMATPQVQSVYATASKASPGLEVDDSYSGTQADEVVLAATEQGMVAQWPDQTWPNPRVQQAHFEGVQALFAGTQTVDGLVAELDAAYTS